MRFSINFNFLAIRRFFFFFDSARHCDAAIHEICTINFQFFSIFSSNKSTERFETSERKAKLKPEGNSNHRQMWFAQSQHQGLATKIFFSKCFCGPKTWNLGFQEIITKIEFDCWGKDGEGIRTQTDCPNWWLFNMWKMLLILRKTLHLITLNQLNKFHSIKIIAQKVKTTEEQEPRLGRREKLAHD